MEILIISTDGYSQYFDRRMTDQANVLSKMGNQVHILTCGETDLIHSVKGVHLTQFQRVTDLDSIKATKAEFFAEHLTNIAHVGEDSPANVTERQNILRSMWKKFPFVFRAKVGPFLIGLYLRLQKIKKIFQTDTVLRNQNITIDIWSDAATFLSVLKKYQPDLIIATDIASGIAALALKQKNTTLNVWYDAHEFGSEQAWIKRRPGFTTELKKVELKIIRDSDLFSCVSKELTLLMVEEAKRNGPNLVLPNIALTDDRPRSASGNEQLTFIRELKRTKKVALFHGVLSDIRGIDKFVEAFERIDSNEWCLVLMGYFLENKTKRAIMQSRNSYIVKPVESNVVLDIVKEIDAVVMPYHVVDLNTEYCFPNKLGDCLATHTKFIFNSGLRSISTIAEEYEIGASFRLDQLEVDSQSLARSLMSIEDMNSNWEKVDYNFGPIKYVDLLNEAIAILFKS